MTVDEYQRLRLVEVENRILMIGDFSTLKSQRWTMARMRKVYLKAIAALTRNSFAPFAAAMCRR
jgi:hypothetical protein